MWSASRFLVIGITLAGCSLPTTRPNGAEMLARPSSLGITAAPPGPLTSRGAIGREVTGLGLEVRPELGVILISGPATRRSTMGQGSARSDDDRGAERSGFLIGLSIGYRVPLGAGDEIVPYARGRLLAIDAEDRGGWTVLAWSSGLSYRLPEIGRFRPWFALEAGWMDWDGYYNFFAGPADGVPPNDRHGYTYGAGMGGDLVLEDRFAIGLELRYERFEANGDVDADIITVGVTFPIWF